jgi:hypothetical protein
MKYKDRFGIGGYFYQDKAGASGYGAFNFMASGSYDVMDDPGNKHQLNVGLQLGIAQISFNRTYSVTSPFASSTNSSNAFI